MRACLVLVRRELEGYFVSLTGYVIITLTLLLLGFSFLALLSNLNGEATEAPLTELFFSTWYYWLIFLLISPVITMRLFALEKSSGTYETLLTTPVNETEIVLAKFTGALIFYAVVWLPLLLYIWIVHRQTPTVAFDLGGLASTFLGLLLIGALYVSIGCFASALTQSQMVAVMVSFGIGIVLFILSVWTLLGAPLKGWASKVLNYVAITSHMEQFARGAIDTRPVVYYLTMTILFLFVTVKVVESRRWN